MTERQGSVWLDIPVGDRDHVWGPATAPVTLVEYGELSKTEGDTIEDFKNVYDFARVFDSYPIDRAAIRRGLESARS